MFIPSYISLFTTCLSFVSGINKQKSFIKSRLVPEINSAKSTNDGTLDTEDFKKLMTSYSFIIPAILAESFCTLRGKKMTEVERQTITFLGAATSLFDDFFDKRNMAFDEIHQIMRYPEKFQPRNSNERMFQHFALLALPGIADKDLFFRYLSSVFTAQVQSMKQTGGQLSPDEIEKVTIDKGGYSFLLYRAAFPHPFKQSEEAALYNLGGFMQLGNDIFDVYKDYKEEIDTLVTRAVNINNVRITFKKQMEKSFVLCHNMDYEKENINRFMNKMLLGVSCCFNCLDQLEGNESKSNNTFQPNLYERTDLICDNEKISNMLKTVKYYNRYRGVMNYEL